MQEQETKKEGIADLLGFRGRGTFSADEALINFIADFPAKAGKVVVIDKAEGNAEEKVAALKKHIHDEIQRAKNAGYFFGEAYYSKVPDEQSALNLASLEKNLKENFAFNQEVSSVAGSAIAWVVLTADSSLQAKQLVSKYANTSTIPSVDLFPVLPDVLNDNVMWHQMIVDHEFGHTLTATDLRNHFLKKGRDLTKFKEELLQMKEGAADAYALIRHYQKYGMDSTFGHYYRDMRVISTVHNGDHAHYTLGALDKIIAMAETGKLKDLTPEQSRNLALQVALETSNNWKIDKVLASAFKPVANMPEMENPQKNAQPLIEAVSNIGAHTACPVIQKTCLRYIDAMERHMPAGELDPQKVQTTREAVSKNAFEGRSLKSAWNKGRWKMASAIMRQRL